MLETVEDASASARDLEVILEADDGLMRLYRGIWVGTFSLFAVWLACVGYYSP